MVLCFSLYCLCLVDRTFPSRSQYSKQTSSPRSKVPPRKAAGNALVRDFRQSSVTFVAF